MEMRVDWTIFATRKVEDIFSYYLEVANHGIVKILLKI